MEQGGIRVRRKLLRKILKGIWGGDKEVSP